MIEVKKNLEDELRGALIEAKESIEGKRKLNTLDDLIVNLQQLQSEGKLKAVEI